VAVAGSGDHAKSYGADEVIDYRNKSDSQLVDAIASAANGQIHHAFDAVAEGGTTEIIVAVLEKTGGGRYTFVLPEPKDIRKVPGVTSTGWTMVGYAHSDPEAAKFAAKWYAQLGTWFDEGTFKPQHIEIVPNGLAGVKEGLKRLKANEVRAAKLVYNIADTPGLQGASL
jgi:NADPH:quinone reductase-like Zn-dependent oxidoreductase